MKSECPSCQQHLEFDAEMAGVLVNCPNCARRLILRSPGQEVVAKDPDSTRGMKAAVRFLIGMALGALAIVVLLANHRQAMRGEEQRIQQAQRARLAQEERETRQRQQALEAEREQKILEQQRDPVGYWHRELAQITAELEGIPPRDQGLASSGGDDPRSRVTEKLRQILVNEQVPLTPDIARSLVGFLAEEANSAAEPRRSGLLEALLAARARVDQSCKDQIDEALFKALENTNTQMASAEQDADAHSGRGEFRHYCDYLTGPTVRLMLDRWRASSSSVERERIWRTLENSSHSPDSAMRRSLVRNLHLDMPDAPTFFEAMVRPALSDPDMAVSEAAVSIACGATTLRPQVSMAFAELFDTDPRWRKGNLVPRIVGWNWYFLKNQTRSRDPEVRRLATQLGTNVLLVQELRPVSATRRLIDDTVRSLNDPDTDIQMDNPLPGIERPGQPPNLADPLLMMTLPIPYMLGKMTEYGAERPARRNQAALHEFDLPKVRGGALTLATMGPVGIEKLRTYLNDSDPEIRVSATGALGLLGRVAAADLTVIESLTRDPDPGVRTMAQWARLRITVDVEIHQRISNATP